MSSCVHHGCCWWCYYSWFPKEVLKILRHNKVNRVCEITHRNRNNYSLERKIDKYRGNKSIDFLQSIKFTNIQFHIELFTTLALKKWFIYSLAVSTPEHLKRFRSRPI